MVAGPGRVLIDQGYLIGQWEVDQRAAEGAKVVGSPPCSPGMNQKNKPQCDSLFMGLMVHG